MGSFFNDNEDYSVPSNSRFMKFEEGDNRFRILGSFSDKTAVRGNVYWKTVDGKRNPVRVRLGVPIQMNELEINPFTGELDLPKHFWALPVYNYQEKRIQLLEINQKSVIDGLKKTIENPKWGDPRDYDFIVTKTVEGKRTSYVVSYDPKEELDESIVDQLESLNINMEALFDGRSPFDTDDKGSSDEGF